MHTPQVATATTPDLPDAPGQRLRRRSLLLALSIALFSGLAVFWLINQSFLQLRSINRQQQDIQIVRAKIGALTDNLLVAESSQRGFILTNEQRDLERYENAALYLDGLEVQLQALEQQTVLPAREMDAFRTALTRVLEDLETVHNLSQQGRLEAAEFAVTSEANLEGLRLVHDRADDLLTQIDTLAAYGNQRFERLTKGARLAFFISVLAMLFAFMLYGHQLYRKREAEMAHRQALEYERARLEQQVQERTHDLADLATHLQQTVERERSHLARELHDELGALMTAAKLDVARLKSGLHTLDADARSERLTHLNDTLNGIVRLKRNIMEDLYPSALHDLGPIEALQLLARGFAERTGVAVDTTLEPVDIDEDAALTVYRMVQEALTNIGRHAQASRVGVLLRQEGGQIRVAVHDDGCGFDPAGVPRSAHGLGGMRHRLRACGGKLDIDSAPGQGTMVTAVIPASTHAGADEHTDPAQAGTAV